MKVEKDTRGVLKIMCGSDLEPLTRHRRVVPFQTVTTVPPTQKGHLTVSLALARVDRKDAQELKPKV